jgi:hypothetical protein
MVKDLIHILDKIRVIAEEQRRVLEDYFDYADNPTCMIGQCCSASNNLTQALQAAGFRAKAVMGTYNNVCDSYPDDLMETLSDQEIDSEDLDLENFDGTWTHCVVVCENHIIDITADQFYLNDPDNDGPDAVGPVVIVPVDDSAYSIGRSKTSTKGLKR